MNPYHGVSSMHCLSFIHCLSIIAVVACAAVQPLAHSAKAPERTVEQCAHFVRRGRPHVFELCRVCIAQMVQTRCHSDRYHIAYPLCIDPLSHSLMMIHPLCTLWPFAVSAGAVLITSGFVECSPSIVRGLTVCKVMVVVDVVASDRISRRKWHFDQIPECLGAGHWVRSGLCSESVDVGHCAGAIC